MEGIRQYVLSIGAAAMVVGILTSLIPEKNTGGVIVRLMGGLFLLFTVMRPMVDWNMTDIREYFAAFSVNGEEAAMEGEMMAMDSYCSYIKTETEAYILDKADAFGAALSVEVSLKDSGIPDSVRIFGNVSPYAKGCLQNMIAEELGISKERQQWIG